MTFASIVRSFPDTELPIGHRIEVLGWVIDHGRYGSGPAELCAVWRDDLGYVSTIPAWAIRMEPHVADEPVDPLAWREGVRREMGVPA